MESLKVLVTGGAGFIGSHLVKALVKAGHQVKVLDNLSTGSIENLADVLNAIEFVRGDVRDYGTVEYAVGGVDAVVHLAALIDVAESVEKPDLYFDVNVRGTYNVVKASKNVSTFVFASSSAVYGEPIRVPIPEDHPLMPKSPYAASKVSGEAFVQAFANQYGFRPVILRLFNVYGPKQSRAYAGVIIEFIRRVSRGESPVIFGDGGQTRDFVHVSDVVEAIMLSLRNEGARGVFNIGSGEGITINHLANLILKSMNREDLKPIYAPPRPGDIRHSIADITRAKKELKYEPKIRLETGIKGLISLISFNSGNKR
jgi:UDP-glucose 4-epimerase